ncbi:YcaO-like family protein [Bacillus spongiae]|uniref:YcaO-like family protein n=1 Tax=Bacillus spongiae TaxID=2683610 RepID=A0ABU8HHR6_9BACI
MIFQRKKGTIFGYKTRKFQATDQLVQAYSRIPNFMDDEGYTGPIECGGIDRITSVAIKKAFSESIERRAVTLGAKGVSERDSKYENWPKLHLGTNENGGYSPSFDLIRQQPVLIPREVTSLRNKKPFIVDTTGTATHPIPQMAKLNAVKELFEKNALFSFWYGSKGKRVNQFSFDISKKLEKMGYELNMYVVDIFAPLQVVILIGHNPNHYTDLKYIFGVGSSVNLEDAIKKATTEAYMLRLYYNVLYFRGEHQSGLSSYDNEIVQQPMRKDVESHIEGFQNLPTYQGFMTSDTNENLDVIIEGLPKWLSQLYITVLPQSLNKEMIVVKAFSPNLINHIPKKEFVEIDIPFISNFLQISETEFDALPDCPII